MSGTQLAGKHLRQLIERIERLEDERKMLAGDIKDIFTEAKSSGFDPKIMRIVLKLRGIPAEDRRELDSLTAVYMDALEGAE